MVVISRATKRGGSSPLLPVRPYVFFVSGGKRNKKIFCLEFMYDINQVSLK